MKHIFFILVAILYCHHSIDASQKKGGSTIKKTNPKAIIEALIVQRNLMEYLCAVTPALKFLADSMDTILHNNLPIVDIVHNPDETNEFIPTTHKQGIIWNFTPNDVASIHLSLKKLENDYLSVDQEQSNLLENFVAQIEIVKKIDQNFQATQSMKSFAEQQELFLKASQKLITIKLDLWAAFSKELAIAIKHISILKKLSLNNALSKKAKFYLTLSLAFVFERFIDNSAVYFPMNFYGWYLPFDSGDTSLINQIIEKTRNDLVNIDNDNILLYQTVIDKTLTLLRLIEFNKIIDDGHSRIQINNELKNAINDTYHFLTASTTLKKISELEKLYKENLKNVKMVSGDVSQIKKPLHIKFKPSKALDYSFFKNFLTHNSPKIPISHTTSIAPKPSPLLEKMLQQKTTTKDNIDHQKQNILFQEKSSIIEIPNKNTTPLEKESQKESVPQQPLSELGYKAIPWCYADRVIAWFKDEEKRKKETTWDCLYHSFPIIVDKFLYNIGIKTTGIDNKHSDISYSLAGEISYKKNLIQQHVIYTVTVDKSNMCYHRGITKKNYQAIVAEFFKNSKWNIDFPPLIQEKSQCTIADVDPTGKIIINNDFQTVIQDGLNDAIITLYKPIILE